MALETRRPRPRRRLTGRLHRALTNQPSSHPEITAAPTPDFDPELYKTRHLIENFFCKLKQFRAIASRYDKTARNFLAAIHLAAAIIWLN